MFAEGVFPGAVDSFGHIPPGVIVLGEILWSEKEGVMILRIGGNESLQHLGDVSSDPAVSDLSDVNADSQFDPFSSLAFS